MVNVNYDFIFNQFQNLNYLNFENSIIWILNANQIPPHIGISTKKKFFSLKYNGKDEFVNTDQYLEKLNIKKIPTVLLELNFKLDLTHITNTFNQYSKANSIKNTCLKPLLRILDLEKECNKISELLNELVSKNAVSSFYNLHLPPQYKGIYKYSVEDIKFEIDRLAC